MIQYNKHDYRGFTLLEVMIAISIFGFLMVYVAQFTRSEIQIFESVSRQNNVEQKARSSMMHILDQIRLHKLMSLSVDGKKITSTDRAIINPNIIDITKSLNLSNLNSFNIFYLNDPSNKRYELWYRSPDGAQYLIADEITNLNISQDAPYLVKIDITAGDTSKGSQPFELRTWIRLY